VKRAFCYLPILRAKLGEFGAVQALSPDARSRLVPLFDVPVPLLANGVLLEDYLTDCANGIRESWGRGRPVYVDVHDFPLDLRTRTGAQPIAHLLNLLRGGGVHAIPVTGTIADREPDYVANVREIIARDRRGACVRLAEDDLVEPQRLGGVIDATLAQLGIGAADTDVILDLRCVNGRHVEQLRATALEALQAVANAGSFRNVTVVGGSVPEVLSKRDVGKVRRESRIEFQVWNQLSDALGIQTALSFGDYGVIHAHFVPPNKGVRVPPRIRYTTSNEHASIAVRSTANILIYASKSLRRPTSAGPILAMAIVRSRFAHKDSTVRVTPPAGLPPTLATTSNLCPGRYGKPFMTQIS
jgi:hypothetical protein